MDVCVNARYKRRKHHRIEKTNENEGALAHPVGRHGGGSGVCGEKQRDITCDKHKQSAPELLRTAWGKPGRERATTMGSSRNTAAVSEGNKE